MKRIELTQFVRARVAIIGTCFVALAVLSVIAQTAEHPATMNADATRRAAQFLTTTDTKARRIDAALKTSTCPKCLGTTVRIASVSTITNVIANGVSGPRSTMERYGLICMSCQHQFRKLEVLAPMPPIPQPKVKARSPKDSK